MDNNTWVKFYRKITENGILKDQAAWAVFSWLLFMVDRETGKRTIGRFQMSDELAIKPNTIYKILHRLEKKWGMISMASQTGFTEITIINWHKYQDSQMDIMPTLGTPVKRQSNDSQTTVKSSSIASNTKQEYKNKELRIERASLDFLRQIPQKDVDELCIKFQTTPSQVTTKALSLANYCEGHGKRYKNYYAMLSNALLKDFGLRRHVGVSQITNADITPQTPEEKRRIDERMAEIRGRFHPDMPSVRAV